MIVWLYIIGAAIHFIFDWFLQPRDMAENKSKDFNVLVQHGQYQFVGALIFFGFCGARMFTGLIGALVYAGIHMFQDWNIWRKYASYRANKVASYTLTTPVAPDNVYKDPWFWNTIAVDQFLHLTILFLIAAMFA